jgi:hypothetical protein
LFTENEEASTAAALARAALELPNRPEPDLAVNPLREASKAMLVAAAVIYKLKTGVSIFLVKSLIARVGGRAVARTWLPFAAVPITALWNAWVAGRVIHQARLRAMGPSAAKEKLDELLEPHPALSPPARQALLAAVGCTAVAKRDLHPNVRCLLVLLRERIGNVEGPFDDRAALLTGLASLPAAERDLVRAVLALAIIISGQITRRERQLWTAAATAVGKTADLGALETLRGSFVAGKAMPPLHDALT